MSESNSVLMRLKAFDVYRDIPNDLTQQTLTGGAISLAAFVIMAFLFLTEAISFMTPEIAHEMFVASQTATGPQAMLQINLNITTPVIPSLCHRV